MRRPAPLAAARTARHGGAGWSHLYAPSPFIFYADGGDPGGDPAPVPTPPGGTAATPPKPAPPANKVFTQEEVEALAAREKDQGKRAGARAALEEFAKANGFTNADDAKAFIEEARKAREAQMSEQEKREKELAERERRAEERERAAAARETAAARRAVLVGLGATGDDLEDAVALLRVDDDADDTAVADAAAKLKDRRPELFGAAKPADDPAAGSTTPPAPGGAPAGGPPARTPSSGARPGDRGREMARLRGHLPPAA